MLMASLSKFIYHDSAPFSLVRFCLRHKTQQTTKLFSSSHCKLFIHSYIRHTLQFSVSSRAINMFDAENDTIYANQSGILSSPSFVDNFTNFIRFAEDSREEEPKLNISYAVVELLIAIFAVAGNALVIIVFFCERRLRKRTNYYIISLAFADFLLGLFGIPFAVLVRRSKTSDIIDWPLDCFRSRWDSLNNITRFAFWWSHRSNRSAQFQSSA